VRTLRIGTRGSRLARAQVDLAVAALHARNPDVEVELVIVQTEGDRRLDVSLDAAGGQGIFVKEIEQRLQANEIDIAVHSLKDMPSELPPGLCIAALLPRADARDALVARDGLDLRALPEGARIGSDSRRRGAQLQALRPGLRVEGIRGNVETRLRKVDDGDYDGVALAVAGLDRLGLRGRATQVFEVTQVIPAPGQGAIAIECREEARATRTLLAAIDDAPTRAATEAERAFLHVLGAGCRLPVGAHATLTGDVLKLTALLAGEDGTLHRGDSTGTPRTAKYVGEALARRLKLEAGI
jgi:hydroxymethylbilane synthase